jgi:NAD-dependent SIR2 family protein deacetylase
MDLNPDLMAADSLPRPDGDADVSASLLDTVQIADCLHCGGILKPDVVFFGDHVPAARVEAAFNSLDQSDALLVVGSSLQVMSGFRFVRHAVKRQIPVYCINQGVTRGDDLMHARIDHDLAEVLTRLGAHCSLPDRPVTDMPTPQY